MTNIRQIVNDYFSKNKEMATFTPQNQQRYIMNDKPEVLIRDATADDVKFVSDCVLASVDLYDFVNDSIEKYIAMEVCGMDDTLYSYHNARIATVDGRAVGCLVSYDGSIYEEARKKTFQIFKDAGREMTDTGVETLPGEYYLDSMAILPEYRGCDIGHILMKDGIEKAGRLGIRKVGLIVEESKPELQKYYSVLGFRPVGEMKAFGDVYMKMILELE